jgi:hypothetical protein
VYQKNDVGTREYSACDSMHQDVISRRSFELT